VAALHTVGDGLGAVFTTVERTDEAAGEPGQILAAVLDRLRAASVYFGPFMRRILGGFLCLAFLMLCGRAGAADARKEAADRFDRGLHLFNEGDNAGALLEFKRAYELSGELSILINVGLVHAEMGRPVDAVEALDKALAQPAGIPAAQVERARRVRDEQQARIGRLMVTTNVPAQVEIDNLTTGHTPMPTPLAVASGGLGLYGNF
jgi:tetratricopeptide (TPR) repeat protein